MLCNMKICYYTLMYTHHRHSVEVHYKTTGEEDARVTLSKETPINLEYEYTTVSAPSHYQPLTTSTMQRQQLYTAVQRRGAELAAKSCSGGNEEEQLYELM